MIISDLNYLETVAEEASVVGGIKNVRRKQVLIFKERIDIKKKIVGHVKVKGNLAFAEGDAQAFGKNTLAQSLTDTYTDQGYGSTASSTSNSASSY